MRSPGASSGKGCNRPCRTVPKRPLHAHFLPPSAGWRMLFGQQSGTEGGKRASRVRVLGGHAYECVHSTGFPRSRWQEEGPGGRPVALARSGQPGICTVQTKTAPVSASAVAGFSLNFVAGASLCTDASRRSPVAHPAQRVACL